MVPAPRTWRCRRYDIRMGFLLALALFPAQATSSVTIRGTEIWRYSAAGAVQLTHDGCAKSLPSLSPSTGRIAYAARCGGSSGLGVIDPSGRRIAALPLRFAVQQDGACPSLLALEWAGDAAVAATCHINPSLNAYVELDVATGRVRRELLGYGFTRSPDGVRVAHTGWYPHFAPPFVKSNYLQADHLVLYPLPPGSRAVELEPLAPPPYSPPSDGSNWSGIHEFLSDFLWSPDSRRIAFLDCVFHWTATGPEDNSGQEHDRRCSVVAVDLQGRATEAPLPDLSPEAIPLLRLSWSGPRQLSVEGPVRLTLPVP